jgi:UDPglucose--hexose-1-phosphate uridylyltransferase
MFEKGKIPAQDWNSPHRRYNPLTGDWVLISPQRTQRPWRGQVELVNQANLPDYDPDCYLCPGNERFRDQRNPRYSSVYVFDNDFPALLNQDMVSRSQGNPDAEKLNSIAKIFGKGDEINALFKAEKENGICRVACFSPKHNATLPDLTIDQIKRVVQIWIDQTLEIGKQEFVRYVQVFENKGEQMGASNPHPHCQIWATEHLPNEPAKELNSQSAYLSRSGKCLLCDYLGAEKQIGERIVVTNEYFTVLVPFWAVWPFEVMLLANRHISMLSELSAEEIDGLADILRRLTIRFDNLFETRFPYSMGFHQAPLNDGSHPEWHLHAHYYPPLLRSATVRKFMVGFELLASPQRDLTAESAAERLRNLDEQLYRNT